VQDLSVNPLSVPTTKLKKRVVEEVIKMAHQAMQDDMIAKQRQREIDMWESAARRHRQSIWHRHRMTDDNNNNR
jgi:hypothetical protein